MLPEQILFSPPPNASLRRSVRDLIFTLENSLNVTYVSFSCFTADLGWWSLTANSYDVVSLKKPVGTLSITIDASKLGWRAVCRIDRAMGA